MFGSVLKPKKFYGKITETTATELISQFVNITTLIKQKRWITLSSPSSSLPSPSLPLLPKTGEETKREGEDEQEKKKD